MRLPAVFTVVLLLASLVYAAATLDDLERAVHEAVQEREGLAQERRLRGAEAAEMADEIARVKMRESAPRADRELERRLRAFDRLASALDDLDRRIRAQDQTIDKARMRFEKQTDDELERLARRQGGGIQLATRVEAIESARRRVQSATAREPTIRPALDIDLESNDGPAELRLKLALLRAERRRFADLILTIDQEIRIIETRLALKRQLVREVQTASADAGMGLSLLQRETDDLLQAIREMQKQRETLSENRARLPSVLIKLDGRIKSMIEKERELTTTRNPEGP